MSDIETRLAHLLRDRAEEVDFDPAEWTARLAAAPTPRRRRPYAVAAAAAATVVLGLVLGGILRTGHEPAPPASETATTAPAGNAAIAGVWRLSRPDSATVGDSREPASRIILAENGWWRAEAGCVALGSWFTWEPATGSVTVDDWAPPTSPLPPSDLADCYRPTILTVVRPGTTWTLKGDVIVVRDQQGAEFARLERTDDPPRLLAVELTTPPDHGWRLVAVANPRQDGPDLGGLQALGENAAPWLRLSIAPSGDRTTIALIRPDGAARACVLAGRDARVDAVGRMSDIRDSPSPEPPACDGPFPAEQRAVGVIGAARAIARGDDGLYLLGDHGAVLAFAAQTEGTSSLSGPRQVTDASSIHGEWWWENDDSRRTAATVQIDPEPQSRFAVVVTAECGRVERELTLDRAGRVVRNTLAPGSSGGCLVSPSGPGPLLEALADARALAVLQDQLWIGGGRSGWASLTGVRPLPADFPPAPLLSRYAAPADVVGSWRLSWSRREATPQTGPNAATLRVHRGAGGALDWTYDGCNTMQGQALTSGDGWIQRIGAGTTLVLCRPPQAWVEDGLLDAAAYGISTRGELLVLSRGGQPLLAFEPTG